MLNGKCSLKCYPPTYPLGSRPSKLYLSLRYSAILKACSGLSVHSKIFFAQYILKNPCIFACFTSCSCAEFHKSSCVRLFSNSFKLEKVKSIQFIQCAEYVIPVNVFTFVFAVIVEGFYRPRICPSDLIVFIIVETEVIGQFATDDGFFAESSYAFGPFVFKLLGA